jgi:hypothetical protein
MTETEVNEPAEKFLEDVWEDRKKALDTRECPICKAINWDLHKNSYVVPATGTFITGTNNSYWQCEAQNSHRVRRADCLSCGFVALFRLGIGPC